MEEWKLVHEIKSTSKTHLKGDKYYISNEGRVKLNDIILDYGTGLYVSQNELRVYGCKLPENTFYRTVYKLFNGELYSGIKYQIHHIDGNHINNKASNLIQVTSKQHGKLHHEMFKNGEYETLLQYNENIKEIQSNIKQLREQAKLFLIEYTNKRLNTIKKERELERELERENKIKQRELDKQLKVEEKLKNGWKYNVNGVLYNPESIRTMVLHRDEDSYKRSGETIKQLYKTNPNYRKLVSKGAKASKGKIYVNNGIKNKLIDESQLDEYLLRGWRRGGKKKIKE